MRSEQDPRWYCVDTSNYANDVLRRIGTTDCKPVSTPLSILEKLSAHEGTLLG
jgi:hypothetical protein